MPTNPPTIASAARRRFLRVCLVAPFAAPWLLVRGAAAAQSDLWFCTNEDCDPYVYNPERGDLNIADPDHPIPPGVAFADLPPSWVCPVCGAIKGQFRPCGPRPRPGVSEACWLTPS